MHVAQWVLMISFDILSAFLKREYNKNKLDAGVFSSLSLFLTDFSCFKAAVLQNILKIMSYEYFKISLQIYIIVVRNKKPTYFHCLLWKQTIRFSAIGIFLLYITATALVTQKIMQRKLMFYQLFCQLNLWSEIRDVSTEHNLTIFYRYFY